MNTTIKLSLITILLVNTKLFAEEKLEDITISTATKTAQNIKDVTSNIHVITAEEIEERQYTTVTEALNSLPGISFTQNGGLGQPSKLRLRGLNQERVLVLIDGVRQNDITGLDGAQLEHLVTSDIEQIEVIKGAQSGVWGADASAGVINIITKQVSKGLNFGLSQEFGSFSTTQSKANISYGNDTFYLKASHSNLDTEGFSAVAPKNSDLNQLEDDGYNNQSTSLKAGIQINATNKIDFIHSITNTKTEADAFDNSTFSFNPNSQYNAESKSKSSSINFSHIDNFNKLDLYVKQSSFNRYYPQENTSTPNFNGEIKEYGMTSNIPYGEENFITWGGEYKQYKNTAPYVQIDTSKAIFITNSNKFTGFFSGKTIITESLRQDQYSTFNNKTTGKIGIKHFHGNINGLITSANYGTGYNVPPAFKLYDPTYGNSNLQAEEMKGYDVSLNYKDIFFTYFNNSIDNLVEYYDPDGFLGPILGSYANINGTSKIKGYELSYNTTFDDVVATNISYTRLTAQNKDKQDLGRRPKENIKLSIDYYGIEDIHLGINGEYIGERYDRNNKQGQQTGKYTVANFVSNYEIDKHLNFYAKVDNITDKYYQAVEGYATSPRAFYVGMRLTY